MGERLQKYLARCGVASRRACEDLIAAGRVRVNGLPVGLGCCVEAADQVQLDGRLIEDRPVLHYWMLHKPVGYVTTVSDPQGRATVMELLPADLPRLYPVGRLDRDSSGLLLFCNDGELTQQLLHPSYECWKSYHCGLREVPDAASLERLRQGLVLDDGLTAPCRARWCREYLEIQLREGRKRQVRRMLGHLGYPVVWLKRVQFGPIQLGRLPVGQARPLTPGEVQQLRG
jgi:23S rRNA pseudouridine2605 synthase